MTSATRGVTRPPSRRLFQIRDECRAVRDGRVEVGYEDWNSEKIGAGRARTKGVCSTGCVGNACTAVFRNSDQGSGLARTVFGLLAQ